ncbi:hypothetical protein [Peredibacter starrii]|uniref:Uncharacterized protein n=1 Tax=Peredibacter starrii TaxID=28202 RepID=A0AAX4HR97_9BACT|nr:hypothetical protein [Peredibacter starrii]WPU65580.1 hypothetical protein SOO65_02345 [Peredibacter starrii]
MKFVMMIAVLLSGLSAFAQTDALSQCRAQNDRLQFQLRDLTARLRTCEQGTGGGYGEVEYLRQENYRLTEQNRQLQFRIDELEGRGYQQFYCVAGCYDVNSRIDTRYMEAASAPTQLEAEMLAKQLTHKTYSCNFGVKTYKCEAMRGEAQMNYCTVACSDVNGRADERFSAGARGRNTVEAEMLAIKELKKTYACNFGIKVTACN